MPGVSDPIDVTVCICTYRRPETLRALLRSLPAQAQPPAIGEVVVVDNDATGSARPIVDAVVAEGLPFPLRYEIQPVKNISLTRNRTLALASGTWVAMIDDDELPCADWVQRLHACATATASDGVLGPVLSVLPSNAPDWIARGDFYDWTRYRTGSTVPRVAYRTSNALVRRALLDGVAEPFDPEYGLTGGEDGRFFCQLVDRGARFVWCDEATVNEGVTTERMTPRWLLMRAFGGGNVHARHVLSGAYGPVRPWTRLLLAARATLQMLAAGALSLAVSPLGRHRSFHWKRKAWANAGKIAAMMSHHYFEYR